MKQIRNSFIVAVGSALWFRTFEFSAAVGLAGDSSTHEHHFQPWMGESNDATNLDSSILFENGNEEELSSLVISEPSEMPYKTPSSDPSLISWYDDVNVEIDKQPSSYYESPSATPGKVIDDDRGDEGPLDKERPPQNPKPERTNNPSVTPLPMSPSVSVSREPISLPSIYESSAVPSFSSSRPSLHNSPEISSSSPSLRSLHHSNAPSFNPSYQSSKSPSNYPTSFLVKISQKPSMMPSSTTVIPSERVSRVPTVFHSYFPTRASNLPTMRPTKEQSNIPSGSKIPTIKPSVMTSRDLSASPSHLLTTVHTVQPTSIESITPSLAPTDTPTRIPSLSVESTTTPSNAHSKVPSDVPSLTETATPSFAPFDTLTTKPTNIHSVFPSLTRIPSLSVEPTTTPSNAHSKVPSNVPSLTEIVTPSFAPSDTLTTKPTKIHSVFPSLTLYPTKNPSRYPSNLPSTTPSMLPTSMPTILPTATPSSTPTNQPSTTPSTIPSHTPSTSPSVVPTVYPSVVPSGSPSFHPSLPPSLKPSFDPTVLPSSKPSIAPSDYPSSIPTNRPTGSPSSIPTDRPSSYPTESNHPSRQPSDIPTQSPSASNPPTISQNPSSFPSISGMPTFQLQEAKVELTMSLIGIDVAALDAEDVKIWETITSSFVRDYLIDFMTHAILNITLLDQTFDYNFDRSRTIHEHHSKSLLITSILSIEFRSERNVDIRRVVGDAFRTENSRFNYRSLLAEANPSVFATLSDVEVDVKPNSDDGEIYQSPDEKLSLEDNQVSTSDDYTGYYVVTSCGLVVLCLISLIGYRHIMHKNLERGVDCSKSSTGLGNESRYSNYMEAQGLENKSHSLNDMEAQETTVMLTRSPNVREMSDDISSIGDPTIYVDDRSIIDTSLHGLLENDNMTLNLNDNISRIYGGNSIIGRTEELFGSIAATWNSEFNGVESLHLKKKVMEIYAPPGRLGIVVDKSSSGIPVIHAVKDNSPMVNLFKPGDEIVAFNQIDTQSLSIQNLTDIVSKTFAEDVRKFVVLRLETTET